MQLFYIPELNNEDLVYLDKEESAHTIKVLRKKAGDRIHITNGKGDLFIGEIAEPDFHKTGIRIIGKTDSKASRPYKLHIAIAPTKNIDRFEWFLEKATEIGIDEISPIITKRSERTVIKPERLEKLIISALKQSNQTILPVLNPLKKFEEIIKNSDNNFRNFIAHCEDDPKKNQLKEQLNNHNKFLILIGPEGDFTKEEIDLAHDNHFLSVSLGDTRLRTETAGIVACNIISVCKG